MRPESISAAGKRALAFAFVLGLSAIAMPRGEAQTFSVVHDFTGGSDGGVPHAGFMIDAARILYGTTSAGGALGAGTVFKMTLKGKETVLHSFAGGNDGADPEASLVMDAAGNLYGTTNGGGAFGAGAVFRVTAKGKETVLYSFTGKADGAKPVAALVMDALGNLYGTTTAGGPTGNGTVFELIPKAQGGKWRESVLYSFGSGNDGAVPIAGVTFGAPGNLYGTTSSGGTYGDGTVFQLKLSKSGWTEHILHNFKAADDGSAPYTGLISDQSLNLYGATTTGGTGSGGTVFKMARSRSGWTFTVLYNIPGWELSGSFRNLIMDASGTLYGTTHCDGSKQQGSLFKLAPSGGTWNYTLLHDFTGGADGFYVYSNLVFDKRGNLYGTASLGGAYDSGVVFKIKP